MASSLRCFSYRSIIGAILFASLFDQISSLNIAYCSSLNTAQTPANSSIYQSNGLCYQFCLSDYAFAILQDHTCWCSNDTPGTSTSIEHCSLQCPGYPDDLCGSSQGLFGYIALTNSPTSTVYGDSSGASSSASQVTVTATPSAINTTKTETPPPSTSSISSSSSISYSPISSTSSSDTTPQTTSSSSISSAYSTYSTSSSSSSSSSMSSTWTPTPITSLETVTGQVRTVTVTPTVPPNSQTLDGISKKSNSGLSTGGAVGLTVGLVTLVALVSSIVFFCIRRRRREKDDECSNGSQRGSSAGLGGPIPSRTMSENSRYILGTDGRQVVETWEPDGREAPGSRRSRLMPVDPRLDPFAPVYQRGENKSRESINTIRDDHDYSRRVHQQAPILRATNPDD